MSSPISPPGEPGAPTPNPVPTPDPSDPDTGPYAPSVFMADYTFPAAGTVVIPPLPRSDGGLIQSVKSATVLSMRDALQGTSMFDKGQAVYIDMDYPMVQAHYPGIWVQFSITKLNRAGVGHETQVQDPQTGNWSFIQEMMFMGRITLTVCALKSIDRDRLCDSIIASLSFARTPQLLATKPQADTKQYRSFITALDENPYVGMTLQLDTIICGGEQASPGTPWADNLITYENSFSFDLVGQFNLEFTHDGLYTLARIDPNFGTNADAQPYNPALWMGTPPVGPYGGGLTWPPGAGTNANVNIPAL